MSPHRLAQESHILVLNMAAVFPQMHRNPICSTEFSEYSSRHWIGFYRFPSLANRGDMINIYT
jgi:hypothetical protein